MIDYKIIGENMRLARIARGWSQTKLAERAELATPTIALAETGVRPIKTLDNLERIAIALDMSLFDLIQGY